MSIKGDQCNTSEYFADNPTDDDLFKITFAKKNYNFDIFNNPNC